MHMHRGARDTTHELKYEYRTAKSPVSLQPPDYTYIISSVRIRVMNINGAAYVIRKPRDIHTYASKKIRRRITSLFTSNRELRCTAKATPTEKICKFYCAFVFILVIFNQRASLLQLRSTLFISCRLAAV